VRLLGSSTVPPPEAVEISPQNIAAVHPNCDASPCDDEPCVNIGGDRFAIVGGRVPCMPFAALTDCLVRVRVAWSMIGHYDFSETFTSGEVFEKSYGYAAGEYELVLTGSFGLVLGDWSLTNRLVGIRDTTATGSGYRRQWDITQTLDQSSGGSIVGNVAPNSIAGVDIPWRVVSGSDIPRVVFSGQAAWSLADGAPCNSRMDFDFSSDTGPTGYVTHTGSLTATLGRWGQFGLRVEPGDGRYRESAERQIRVLEMELADGTVLVFDQCDVPQPRIAVACDPQADPQEITYDAQTMPAWAVSMIEIETGLRYLPTNTPSTGSPITVVYEGEGCPEPPADLWPIARECNGTRTLTFDPATRPADGVTFIVGTVRYRPTSVMSEEAPSSGTWSPDPCTTNPCDDLILNDPRCSLPQYRDCPQCVGFDIGDPQPEPDFDVQDDGTIPGLGDMVAEAIRTISLNTILPCSACERRKQVLNRFGERAGRAVIRLLRW